MVESQNVENGHGMIFYINGTEAQGAPLLLGEILARYGILPTSLGVAVAVNERVVSRSAWEAYAIAPQDRVEIVRAFQGG